jgi:integrase
MSDIQAKAKALGDPDGIPPKLLRPARAPENFPMGIHPNGQYWKKRLGRPYYFGAVSAGWRAALDRFNHEWPYLLAGRTPPPMNGDVDAASVEYVARSFIGREIKRLDRSLLKGHSFVDIRNAVEIATVSLGKHKKVEHLLPSDFADLRDALSYVWVKEGEGDAARWAKTDVRIGAAALKRRIVHVRAMFNWARREKLVVEVPSYGDDFKLVTETTLNKARKMSERKNGAKRFEPGDVLPIYNALDAQLQAAFLLSLNCGFTAADCSALPWHAVHLDKGYIDFARVKTGVDRLRMFLWPETVEALRHVKALKLKPAAGLETLVVHQDRGDLGEPIGDPIPLRDCVFITSRGRPWVERTIKRDAFLVEVCL